MYIKRAIEDYVKEALKQFKVVEVYGSRQVGKSTMLNALLSDSWDKVTLDDEKELEMAVEDRALFVKNHKLPLFIDEVQYAPELLRQIKLVADSTDEMGRFCISGSQLLKLSSAVHESLAGRACTVEMTSLSLREIKRVGFSLPFVPDEDYINKRQESVNPYDDIWGVIFRGAMPALWNNQSLNREIFYRSYLNTYISRDVSEILDVKSQRMFLKFLRILASQVSTVLNMSSIANDIQVSVNTVREWISVLQHIGIIRLLYPFESNLSKRLIKSPKVYFMDTGLVCYLVGWNSVRNACFGADSGKLFENFVVSEVFKSFLNSGMETDNLFFYRDKEGREIDLLILCDNVFYPVEIKRSTKPVSSDAKHFPVLSKFTDKNIGRGTILCQCDKKLILSDDLIALPIEFI